MLAVLAGTASPLTAQDRVTLTGIVRDSASGAPVERVTVYLPNGPKTESGRDGRFSLTGVKIDENMMLMIDGFKLDTDMIDDIAPSWIAGIEVYHGLGNIPLDLTMGETPGCGVVAIWTGGEGM